MKKNLTKYYMVRLLVINLFFAYGVQTSNAGDNDVLSTKIKIPENASEIITNSIVTEPVTTHDFSIFEPSAITLSKFGNELNLSKEITIKQEELITNLAKISIPVPKLIEGNALSTTGVNFLNQDLIVLDSLTGEPVDSCGVIGILENGQIPSKGQGCDIEVINPSEELKNALKITSTLDGHILKNEQKIPAKFVVIVKALYEGSECETTCLNGVCKKVCKPPRPNRR